MKNEYVASIGQKTFAIKIVGDGEVVVDGNRKSFSFTPVKQGTFSLLLEGKSYAITIPEHQTVGSDGAISVSVNGKSHKVVVADEQTHRLKSIFAQSASRSSELVIKAPMPGLISRIEVVPGDEVTPGNGLIVLEAMKMENEIRSTLTGRVLKIHVEKGRAVEKGEPLVTIG